MIKNTQLLNLISSYRSHFPNEEDTCNEFMQTLKLYNNNFFSRENYIPGHITASSFVVTPNADYILMIFHKTLKRWLQPGGHVEANDKTIENAAERELAEETNLTPPFHSLGLCDLDIHTIPQKKGQPSHKHFDMRFLFVSDKLSIKAGSDASDAAWVSVAKLTPDNSDESILRALRKIPNSLKSL